MRRYLAVVATLALGYDLLGTDPGEGWMKVDLEGFRSGDRTDLSLPKPQQELIKAVQSLGLEKLEVVQPAAAALEPRLRQPGRVRATAARRINPVSTKAVTR